MNYYKIIFASIAFSSIIACKNNVKEDAAEPTTVTGTPITLTSPTLGNMREEVELNAVSAFLLKTNVKSNTNGYLQIVNASLGKLVHKGDDLFVIKTKEASVLENSTHSLDSSLHFKGVIHVKAPGTGYITQINYQPGD